MTISPECWFERKSELEMIAQNRSPVRIINDEILNDILFDLLLIESVDKIFYKIETNPHPRILEKVYKLGGCFKCVNSSEIKMLSKIFNDITPDKFLFAPGSTNPKEYEYAFNKGIPVILDSTYPLKSWPQIFRKREVLLFIRPEKLFKDEKTTSGREPAALPGIPPSGIKQTARLLKDLGIMVKGLHIETAHMYNAGYLDLMEAVSLLEQSMTFSPDISFLSLGSAIGFSDQEISGFQALPNFCQQTEDIKNAYPQCKLLVEPDAFIFSNAGVILTEVKEVSEVLSTDENNHVLTDMDIESFFTQSTYDATHDIINLSGINRAACLIYNPAEAGGKKHCHICYKTESAPPKKGDLLLVTNMGIKQFNLNKAVNEYYLNARKICPVKF